MQRLTGYLSVRAGVNRSAGQLVRLGRRVRSISRAGAGHLWAVGAMRSMVLVVMGGLLSGCLNPGRMEGASSAAQEDTARIKPAWWLEQPDTAHALSMDYDALWNSAAAACHDRLFELDQRDYRQGLMTTQPMVSKQFWELWRNDVVDLKHLARSSMATLRRTVYISFTRQDNGSYTATPQVVIERFNLAERRVTSVWQFRETILGAGNVASLDESEQSVPSNYWYAIGRDHDLERALAKQIQRKVSERKG